MTALFKKLVSFFREEPLRLCLLYIPLHSLVFFLTQYIPRRYTDVCCALDGHIPLVPFFSLPYLLWFVYMALGILVPFFSGNRRMLRVTAFVTLGGMFFCLCCCLAFPTHFPLRPEIEDITQNDPFAALTRFIYSADQPFNVFPSMHCQGALSTHFALCRSEFFARRRWTKILSLCFVAIVCASTVLIKQHSVLDVLPGLLVAAALWLCVRLYEKKRPI